jgi:hypothetical protein
VNPLLSEDNACIAERAEIGRLENRLDLTAGARTLTRTKEQVA